MRRRRRTEITVETHRVLFVHRQHRRIASAHCDVCAADVPMSSIEYAAAITGRGLRQLLREVECGHSHAREIAKEALLLCMNSICTLMPQTGELVDSLMCRKAEVK